MVYIDAYHRTSLGYGQRAHGLGLGFCTYALLGLVEVINNSKITVTKLFTFTIDVIEGCFINIFNQEISHCTIQFKRKCQSYFWINLFAPR